jgi:hypothetical protein
MNLRDFELVAEILIALAFLGLVIKLAFYI